MRPREASDCTADLVRGSSKGDGERCLSKELWLPRAVSQPGHILQLGAEAPGLHPPHHAPKAPITPHQQCGQQVLSLQLLPAGNRFQRSTCTRWYPYTGGGKEISFKQAGSKDGGALPFIQLSGGLAASSMWYNNSVPTCLRTVLRIPVVPLASVLGPAATAWPGLGKPIPVQWKGGWVKTE